MRVEEVEDFVAISDALAVNIGTLSPPWVAAMRSAVTRARALGKPWVLDPVGCGATAYRTQVAVELAGLAPSVIRGNASEILTLAGQVGAAGKGVDSSARAEDATAAAALLAQQAGCVVAVTGATDYVCDGASCIAIHSGHALMPLSTALGCSLSAVTAAFTAVRPPRLAADRRARRIRRRRRRGGATLPGPRPSAGGNLRCALSNGPRHARPPCSACRLNGFPRRMQTTFSLAQLLDPQIVESEKILRACVHCGFCTATCPTYVLLGDELDSPRGRIYLIKDMLEQARPATRRRGQAYRPLPVVPCLHDHLSVRRALHASGRSRPRAHRENL